MEKEKKKTGIKFGEKYKVAAAQVYKGLSESLRIPPPGHFLHDPTAPTTFDEMSVQQIDADGKMTTPMEVFTDTDKNILWIIDGRGRFLNVQEVNKRRAKDGRELVEPLIVPFSGDEKAAVARVRIKNYHRRTPTPSGIAVDVNALRNAGYSWAECAAKLHIETIDPDQYFRKLMPLAFCTPEVRAAIDAGTIPKGAAREFGGGKLDGTAALGPKGQSELLAKMLSESKNGIKTAKVKTVKSIGAKLRGRVRAALSNGATAGLKAMDNVWARAAAATLAWIEGDKNAFKQCPDVESIIEAACQPLPRGPKVKGEKKVKEKKEKKAKKEKD